MSTGAELLTSESNSLAQDPAAELQLSGERICTGRALVTARKEHRDHELPATCFGKFTCLYVTIYDQPGTACQSMLESDPEFLRRATPERRCQKTHDKPGTPLDKR